MQLPQSPMMELAPSIPTQQFLHIGLDADLLAFVPQPVLAVLLLFPITDEYEKYRGEEEARIGKDGQKVSDTLYFTKQTIPNACGTIGLLHSLANNTEALEVDRKFLLGEDVSGRQTCWLSSLTHTSCKLAAGGLSRILERTAKKSPNDRAKELELDQDLARAHEKR